jgi:DNA adenine methylase
VLRYRKKPDQLHVEPFVGGANSIDKVKGPRLAADIDPTVIGLWKAVSDGWMPPEKVTIDEYKKLKNAPDDNPLKGYVAFNLSFGAKKFGGGQDILQVHQMTKIIVVNHTMRQ